MRRHKVTMETASPSWLSRQICMSIHVSQVTAVERNNRVMTLLIYDSIRDNYRPIFFQIVVIIHAMLLVALIKIYFTYVHVYCILQECTILKYQPAQPFFRLMIVLLSSTFKQYTVAKIAVHSPMDLIRDVKHDPVGQSKLPLFVKTHGLQDRSYDDLSHVMWKNTFQRVYSYLQESKNWGLMSKDGLGHIFCSTSLNHVDSAVTKRNNIYVRYMIYYMKYTLHRDWPRGIHMYIELNGTSSVI